MSRLAAVEGEKLREYSDKFLLALKPIIQAATGSTLEIELARTYLRSQRHTVVYEKYHKQMSVEVEGKPVWHWLANKNEKLLLDKPELIIGNDNERIKNIAKGWIALLTAQQKDMVWQWAHGMLTMAGYDITEAIEQHQAQSSH